MVVKPAPVMVTVSFASVVPLNVGLELLVVIDAAVTAMVI